MTWSPDWLYLNRFYVEGMGKIDIISAHCGLYIDKEWKRKYILIEVESNDDWSYQNNGNKVYLNNT